jgi:hypothetical protein
MSRYWPALILLLAGLAAITAHLIISRLTRDPPNYTQIEDGLWLGGHVAEPPPGAGAVLNLCELEDAYQAEAHRWESIREAAPGPGIGWLRDQVKWITAQREAGRGVYVHCRNGVSRSALVLAAYLMWREGWPRDRAIAYLRERREIVRPHSAFMKLLIEWERAVKE